MNSGGSEHEEILTIVNNLADAVFSVDQKGVIRLYNAAGLNLLDTNTGIDNKKLSEVFKLEDEDGKPVDLFKEVVRAHAVTVNDRLRMRFGDDVMRLEFTYAPIRSSFNSNDPSGIHHGYVIIARDITRIKSLEEERDEFISVVSHELRTPVTIAEGTISNAQVMLERNLSDTKALKESLREAHDQVIYLAKMVNDLSTLSRAERGVAADPEMIDVASMAHDLYNEYHPEAEKVGLHLNLELGTRLGHVNASRLYLHELLQNFITNSIKYTKQGSVTLCMHRRENELEFEVKDTGIGISKSDQIKVFEKFYRSEDYRTRETNGTGLGLYVSKKLAKKIGTKIILKSRLNHGSSFSFCLPIAHQ